MSVRGRVTACFVFGVTMGLFEAAVAVYLWRLLKLGQIDLANVSFENRLILTEVLREAASLVMIVTVATLAGRRGLERLAYTAIIFGVWDILYYVYLHYLNGWPNSPLDWDILFLIPRPWIGPVLAPCLVSVALIVCGLLMVSREDRLPMRPAGTSWVLAVSGGAIVIVSFLLPTVPPTPDVVPTGFSWVIFGFGLALALVGFVHAYTRR